MEVLPGMKATAFRFARVPAVRRVPGDQLEPSGVNTMVPESPTAMPVKELAEAAPFKDRVVLLACGVQLDPPFVVLRIIPSVPTAQPVSTTPKATALGVVKFEAGTKVMDPPFRLRE